MDDGDARFGFRCEGNARHTSSDDGHVGCTRSDDGIAGSASPHDGNARCTQSDNGNAGSASQHDGSARCTQSDNGNAGSAPTPYGGARHNQGEHIRSQRPMPAIPQSDRKRKDELTTSEMLTLVHAHAWMHVMDDASQLPSVLGMSAQVWLTVLPQEEQANLAVHYQNVVHATARWECAVQAHGLESDQSGREARRLHDVQDRKLRYLQHCERKAEMILSAGATE